MKTTTNLDLFLNIVKQEYLVACETKSNFGSHYIPPHARRRLDTIVRVDKYNRRGLLLRLKWRREVAKMYNKLHGLNQKAFNIDWGQIAIWIRDHILPILKTLLTIAPFFI